MHYHDNMGHPLGPLLTQAEIQHLYDVAQLVDRFRMVAWVAVIAGLLLAPLTLRYPQPPPSLAQISLTLLATTLILGGAILLTGPVEIFYALHVWLFPPEHQWYFYYEESLMSMMMQAPNLFGPIAVMWVVSALLLTGLFWQLLALLHRHCRTA